MPRTPVAATLAGADVGVAFTARPGDYLAGDWWVTQVRGSSANAVSHADRRAARRHAALRRVARGRRPHRQDRARRLPTAVPAADLGQGRLLHGGGPALGRQRRGVAADAAGRLREPGTGHLLPGSRHLHALRTARPRARPERHHAAGMQRGSRAAGPGRAGARVHPRADRAPGGELGHGPRRRAVRSAGRIHAISWRVLRPARSQPGASRRPLPTGSRSPSASPSATRRA